MSWTRHHAIVLTSWDEEKLRAAWDKAVELDCSVSEITEQAMNYYRSFLVAPDGGAEGRDVSEIGWRRRCALIDWLREQYTEGNSSYIDWVEVYFGDSDHETRVTRASDLDAEGIADTEEVY